MNGAKHRENEPVVIARITDLLIEQRKNQNDLLQYLHLNRNVYSEWKAGRKNTYWLYLDNIATFLGVSPTYLVRGEQDNEILRLTQKEQELIHKYRHLGADTQDRLLEMATELEKQIKE